MGLKLGGFVAGILWGTMFGVCLSACATGGFGYHYYGLELPKYDEGKLIGPTDADSLEISICTPTAAHASPCTVFLTGEFEAMKQELVQKRKALIDCQNAKDTP